MHFPISGVDCPLWLPPLVAFSLSFFTSMGGVSGAFLLLPFQISVLGYTSPGVSGTNHIYNLVAIPGGVYRYLREGRMVWSLVASVVAGTLPGVVIGAWIRVRYLPDPRHFKGFAALILLYLGARLAADLLTKKKKTGDLELPPRALGTEELRISGARLTWKEGSYTFAGRQYRFSPPLVLVLCLVVGVAGGIYGIGGGAIVAPVFVAIFKLPVYTVAGAALLGTFFTSIAGVGTFHLMALSSPESGLDPDWLLGSFFGAGGLAGTYLGARLQKFVPERFIKLLLCACLFFIALNYGLEFFR